MRARVQDNQGREHFNIERPSILSLLILMLRSQCMNSAAIPTSRLFLQPLTWTTGKNPGMTNREGEEERRVDGRGRDIPVLNPVLLQ